VVCSIGLPELFFYIIDVNGLNLTRDGMSMKASGTDSAKDSWAHPDCLDAMIAAPAFHELLFENEHVRVLHTRILPGQTVPVHTHRWPHIQYIISWSPLVRRDAEGNVMYDSRTTPPPEAPHVAWSEPLPPHSVNNVGDGEISVIGFELKTAVEK
jgi:hypothetical protein